MNWQPIPEAKLWDLINAAWDRMSPPQKQLWEVIKIAPEKWQEPSYGQAGDGFWVVGLIGRSIVWYNDIEDGFNRSRYIRHGTIAEYWCNQDELEVTVQRILDEIRTGSDPGPLVGPPRSGQFNSA
jgi:hypothetical protein